MRYRVEIAKKALKTLSKLPSKARLQIIRKIDKLTDNPFPSGAEPIKGQTDIRRIKSGNYRILYTVVRRKVLVLVLHVSDRKNVYDYFNR